MSIEQGLPAGWRLAPLSEIAAVNPRKASISGMAADRPVHFVPMASVSEEFGGIDVSATRPLGEVQKGYTQFLAGDVLFAKITPCMENGKGAVVPELTCQLGYGSTEFHVVRPKPGLRSKWLAYFLSRRDIRRVAQRQMTGSAGQLRVPGQWLEALQIPLPLPPIQDEILSKVDELLSDLDAGVSNLERAQTNLKRYRATVLKAAVAGRLTAGWRRQNTQSETGKQLLARILKERRAKWEADQVAKFTKQGKIPPKGWQSKYVEPAAPDTTELPELPAGWHWMSLRQITEPIQHSVKAGPFGSALKKEFFTSTGYKVYGQEQVIRGDAYYGDYFIDEEKYQELQSCRVKPGDLLISLVGTIGRTLVLPPDAMPGIINPRLIKLTLAPNVVSPEFIRLYFASPFVKSIFKLASHGGTMEILNMGILEALPFPIPPLDEQRQIVLSAEDVTSNIMRTEEEITSQLSKAASLRQAILKSAFSGKLLEESSWNQATSEAAA